MTLERQVDPPPATVGATAARMALSCLVGATAVAIAFVARPKGEAPPPPTPAAAPHITVTAPPPIVLSLETVVEAPARAPADNDLGCPLIAADEPIGKPVPQSSLRPEESQAKVAAAREAPVLVVQSGVTVWVSDDDGRTWQRAFANHDPAEVEVAPDGTVYAREDDKLGVRVPGGKTVWRTIPRECSDEARCVTAIFALGNEVIAFADDVIRTSTDRGKTWTKVKLDGPAWTPGSSPERSEVFTYRDALYHITHYWDRCGVDDWNTFRFDTAHRSALEVFHNYYSGDDEPVLVPSNDHDTQWTWADRCRVDSEAEPGRCRKRQPLRRMMMEAAMLRPREGARALAVYGGALIELCTGGVRQVYREFPFERLDAVDASGRALVMNGGNLLRWSPQTGWRKLRAFEAPSVEEE